MPILAVFRRPPSWPLVAASLLLTATLLRMGLFGNPLYGDDEPFYLFVAHRLLHGDVPYVDIWDRKPFGLFMVFVALRWIGGAGVVAPQIAATLSVAATAWVAAVIAGQRWGRWPAWAAGVFYITMAGALGGMVAQTPVFYNLLLAVAAWLILRTAPALDRPRDLARASAAMLLCGVAIQIKTDALFEGGVFGAWLAARLWRTRPMAEAAWRAALFAVLGVLPTLLIGLGFWWSGHWGAWWFATFQSQALKTGGFDREAMWRLGGFALQATPSLTAATVGLARLPRDERWWLFAAWFAATLGDAVAIGNFWTHYALPLVLVASILSAGLWSVRWVGPVLWLAVMLPFGISQGTRYWWSTRHARVAVAETLRAIPADVKTRCLLGYETPVAYYQLTDACLVTPYIFIDQLRSAAEAHALPVDASVALRQALARRPGTILTLGNSRWKLRNRANDAILARALARDYARTATIPQRRWKADRESVVVWRRRDLTPRAR